PFYAYARQDRKDQPRVPITAKLVANLLVAAGADRVVAIDLHAGQIQGFFDIPVDHLYAFSVLHDYVIKKDLHNLVTMSSDLGGVKMADAYARTLNSGLGFVAKKRYSGTQVEATNVVGDVKGCDVLLVDDMTETAGTLQSAAKIIKEHGARRIIAAVTHANFQEMAYERLKDGAIDELVVTNTIPVDPRDLPVTVLSVASLLGEAIVRISNNESVTSLFRVKGF
ncbi:UNVERIFIED_CONTAM: hypothetical protein GTU68_040418, partial [Idotea baltica]|nr:hypothetical protein [Idotea baltica]